MDIARNGGRRPAHDASYLHPNGSSVLMHYQTGLNNSVVTNDKSSAVNGQQSQTYTARNGASQSPPDKGKSTTGFTNEYGYYVHA